MPVPMDDIRHVIALDMGKNMTKDHIVEHAYAGPPYYERPSYSKLPRFSRYVSGLDISIPWPQETEPHVEPSELDTRATAVSDVSWVPSLDHAPFPPSVLDELRNKYSRFRTRHDPEYVKEKVLEEYRQEYLKSQSLLTPKGEHVRLKATKSTELKKAKMDADGNVIMDQETNDFIKGFLAMQMGQNPSKKSGKSSEAQLTA